MLPAGGLPTRRPRRRGPNVAYALPAAFDAGVREGAQGLLTTAESIFRAQRARVTELAARHRLPAIYPYSAFVTDAEGLMAYSINDSDLHARAATATMIPLTFANRPKVCHFPFAGIA